MFPYIFIFGTSVLSCMRIKVELEGKIQGMKASRSAPFITHLMHAKDLILFFKAITNSCQKISNILIMFEDLSKLHVDKEKI